MNHLTSSVKGWIEQVPVKEWLIGAEVQGARDTGAGELELIICPRKRRVSASERQRILARRALANRGL